MIPSDLLNKLLTRASQIYEMDYFALFVHAPNQPIVLHSYPEDWVSFYLAQKYQAYDVAHSKDLRPVLWHTGQIHTLTQNEREIFERAAGHGIYTGYTTPLQVFGNRAHLTFASSQNTQKARQYVEKHKYYYMSLTHVLSLAASSRSQEQKVDIDVLDHFLKDQSKDLSASRERYSIARSSLVIASDLVRTLPSTLRPSVEEFIDLAHSALMKDRSRDT